MPTPDDHLSQWRHNRAFLSTIPLDYHDWIITATFYTALHAVDALLAFDNVTVTNHEGRNRTLGMTNRYERINNSYWPLYNLSRTVRYLAKPNTWVPASRVQKDVIERYLYPIERSVQKLIGRDLALPPVTLRT
jgi:hypothetical protein